MAWTDDQIDELYRQAAQQHHPEFKEEYWKEMETLLDEQSHKKRIVPRWSIGVFFLSIASFATGYYFYTDQKEQQHPAIKTPLVVSQQTNIPQTTAIVTQSIVVPSTHISHSAPLLSNDETPLLLTPNISRKIADNTVIEVPITHPTTVSSASSFDVIQLEKITAQQLRLANSSTLINSQVNDPIFGGKVGFYAGAGLAINQSYQRNSPIFHTQWNIKIGADYAYTDRLRFGFGFGFRREKLQYGAGKGDLAISQTQVRYSLGEMRQTQSVAYSSLQFVDLNMHAHYLLGNFRFGILLSPSYMLGAKSHASRYQTGIEKDESNQHIRAEMPQYVRTKNLNAFGLTAGVSLQYEFNNHILLEIGASSRLNKMMMNDLFEVTARTFPIRFEFGLTKRFSK